MINFKKFTTQFVVIGVMVAAVAAPLAAQAQTVTHWVDRQLDKGKHSQSQAHQQHQKNDWRNLGYAGGGVAVVGILTHNPLLMAVGVTGGLYSTYRYEQDRKSQSSSDRRRAAWFSQKSRTIDGHRYRRVTVTSNGHQYYAYKRS